jgi:hypothetical protein
MLAVSVDCRQYARVGDALSRGRTANRRRTYRTSRLALRRSAESGRRGVRSGRWRSSKTRPPATPSRPSRTRIPLRRPNCPTKPPRARAGAVRAAADAQISHRCSSWGPTIRRRSSSAGDGTDTPVRAAAYPAGPVRRQNTRLIVLVQTVVATDRLAFWEDQAARLDWAPSPCRAG